MKDINVPTQSKYRNFVHSSRMAMSRALKARNARLAVQMIVDDLASQLSNEYQGMVIAEAVDLPGGRVQVRLMNTANEGVFWLIKRINFSDSGFPATLEWDGTLMHCDDASDICEAIWTALSRVEVGDFLLDLLPDQYTKGLADYTPDGEIIHKRLATHAAIRAKQARAR